MLSVDNARGQALPPDARGSGRLQLAEWLTDPAYNNNAAVQNTYWSSRVLVRGEFTIGGGGGHVARRAGAQSARPRPDPVGFHGPGRQDCWCGGRCHRRGPA